MADLGTPPVRRVQLYLCDACLDSDGGECHVPGCSFWMSAAPAGVPIRDRQLVTVSDADPLPPRGPDGFRAVICGNCGTKYGTNFADEEIDCPECEARRCPDCGSWFGAER